MANKSIQLLNFKTFDISPKESDPEIAALLPTRFKAEYVEFELKNVNIGIAHGLRRIISGEIKAKALDFKFEDFSTNEEYMLNDFIRLLIRNIPIDQSIDTDTEFELDYTNNSANNYEVKSRDITVMSKNKIQLPFNETFTLALLRPSRYIRIRHIKVVEGYEYEYGGFKLACRVACLPLDQKPIDLDTENTDKVEGISSSVSDPREHKILFSTNGTISPKKILLKACDEFTTRLKNLNELLDTIEQKDDFSMLIVTGESETIGNAVLKTALDMYPNDIKFMTYNVGNIVRRVTFKIKYDGDIKDLLGSVIREIMRVVAEIKRQV